MKHTHAHFSARSTWFSVALALAGLHATAHAQTGSSDGSISKCDRALGTLAVAEPQNEIIARLTQYKLGSPSTMLRMIAQESGCFHVVERGVAMQNIQQERALAADGMLHEDANVGGGQLQAADFVLTPSVQFSDDTGGMGAAVGGLLGRLPGVLGSLGGLAGGLTFKEAETTLLLADVRSGIQVASAEGQAKKMDFSVGGWGWGGMGWAAAGGYSKTPEGKLIAASLLDNFNRIVATIRNKPSLVQNTSKASRVNAAASTKATQPMGRVARLAPPAAGPSSNGLLPSGLIGNFAGSFEGQDEGNFSAVVGANGVVSGSGYSNKYNVAFVVSGLVSATGDVQMTGSGKAGSATFVGQIDQASGGVIGQWRWVSGPGKGMPGGSFHGQRE